MILFLSIFLAVLIIIFTLILFGSSKAYPKDETEYRAFPPQDSQNRIPESDFPDEVRPFETDEQ